MTPCGVTSLDPRGLIGWTYAGDHYTLLHTKYISSGPHGFREEYFLSFTHFMSMGAISRHGGHLDLRTVTIFTNFQSPFNTTLHIKFENIGLRISEKSFKGVNGQTDERTDGRTDRRTDDGR